MAELFNFNEIGAIERSSMKKNRIDFSKLYSRLSEKSREDSKPSHCLYCEQKHNKFCNSHSVPASFLRNIAVDGKVYTTNKILDLPLFDTEKGVNNSGTFQLICRQCDNQIFREYENYLNYKEHPTDKMIAQIALKNHMRFIGKRRFEISLYNNMKEEFSKKSARNHLLDGYIDDMLRVANLDLLEYIRDFKHCKKIIEKEWLNEHYLFYYEKLDYTVPIAFQGEVCLNFDFLGHPINDIYNKSKDYKLQTLHISIFPIESQSIIMLFTKNGNKRLRQFYKQYSSLEHKDKLSAINFIIFSLSEDVFMSKSLHDRFMENDSLKRVAGLTSIQFSEKNNISQEGLTEEFDLSKRNDIPNFLLMEN